ncbi:hypothetical protein [Spiroplasma taiwanense]|nr:hypothetical protein [Spiroplasma taiwanense]
MKKNYVQIIKTTTKLDSLIKSNENKKQFIANRVKKYSSNIQKNEKN